MEWSWIPAHLGAIGGYALENLYLGVIPALAGLLISLPLGIGCVRWGWLYPPVLTVTSLLYALPSLALFVVLIPYTGLTPSTVIIVLTLFSLCVIVPNVVDGLRGVPEPVRQSATAMGFGPLRRLVRVELPIAVPVVLAGLRVAVVSGISLATVGQLIGVSSLGTLFIDGYQRGFPTEIIVSIVLIVALAVACDLMLVLARRLLTPWLRGQPQPGRRGGAAPARVATEAAA